MATQESNRTLTKQQFDKQHSGWLTGWMKQQVFKQLSQIKQAHLIIIEGNQQTSFGDEMADLQVSMEVHDDSFYLALALQGSVGVAESYQRGDWDCQELTRLVRIRYL